MVGFTAERFADYYVRGQRDDIPNNSESLHEVDAGTLNQLANGTTSYNTLVSYIGRLMYNFDNRYYATASLRADGSSKFPVGNKYAWFPSASVAWRIIGEEFMADQQVFSNLKLHAGWGRVGNQNIDNSAYLTLLGASDAVFGISQGRFPGTTISSVGNAKLKWETVEDFDIGLDMSFLTNRLDVTVDVYQKKSYDMLYKKQNIFVVGYPDWNSQVTMNIGSMKAVGWELGINWRDKVADFDYNVGVNLSAVKNKAIKLSGDGPISTGGFNSDQILRNEDGAEIGRFYGYVADGIFQNQSEVNAHTDEHGNILQPNAVPGDIRFKDLNHDGVLNENDKTYIGNAYPDLMMGVNMGARYKNFDLTANFYGTFGNDIYNTTKGRYSGANGQNVFAGTLDQAWHGEGTSNDIPRLTVSDTNLNYNRVSSFYVEDGSYFRCKLLQLGYTLPKQLMRGTELRFSISAQNLFTITGYSGMDPERPQMGASVIETGIDWISYPNPRTFLFGIDFKF
jgi:TonB-linked SusC/RagA family outer membrane protein